MLSNINMQRSLFLLIGATVILVSCSKQPIVRTTLRNRLLSFSVVGGFIHLPGATTSALLPFRAGLMRAETQIWNRLLSLSPGTGRPVMSGLMDGTGDASLSRDGRAGSSVLGNQDADSIGWSGSRAASSNFLKSFHAKYGHLLASVPAYGGSSSGGGGWSERLGWIWSGDKWIRGKATSSGAGNGSGNGSSGRSSSSGYGTGNGNGGGNGSSSPMSGTGSAANGIASFSCDPGSMIHLMMQEDAYPWGLCMFNSPFPERLGGINDIPL